MKKSRYSLFVALALAAISTSACEDTVSLSVKCDGNQPFWTEKNGNQIIGGKCTGGVVGPVEFNVELSLSNGEKAVVCKKEDKCDKHRYILSATDDKIVAEACKEGDIVCRYCCDNNEIAKCSDATNEAKTNSLCGDGSDENTSYQCKGTSVIVQKCESGCANGECGEQDSNNCADGKYRCSDGKIQICENSGWKDAKGEKLCDKENQIWKCNDAGVAEPKPCGDGAVCKDGKCTDPVCDRITDSGLVCKGGKVGKCDSDKQWTELTGDVLCENDQILYCKNENEKPEPVGCYSEGDITSVCKQKDGKIVKDDSGCGNGMECNEGFECEPKKYTCTAEDKYVCTNGGMLYDCNGKTEQVIPPEGQKLKCEDSKVVWCKQEDAKHTANKTECSPNGSVEGCAEWCKTCDSNGSCTKCNKPLERCADDLNGKTVCSESRSDNNACNYCYNSDFENGWVDESKLVCGCVPNEYNTTTDNNIKGDSTVCYKGMVHKLNHNKHGQAIGNILLNNTSINENVDKVWEFALRPPVGQTTTIWEYYNCHNDAYEKASDNLSKPKFNCCEEGSFFIERTGYKYYQVELCKKIKNRHSDVTAFQFDTGLNDALIGMDNNFLETEIACLNVKSADESKDTPMILIKDSSNDKKDNAVYRAFKCLDGTACNSYHKQLCMIPNVDTNAQFYCSDDKVQIMQSPMGLVVAECPDGTVLQIRENDTTWRDVVHNDCGTDKTHNLGDFRCYLGKSDGDKDSNS